MKANFLKLAGVKTEKEFYKKFPTEEAFMAKHGKMLEAKYGKVIKAQFGLGDMGGLANSANNMNQAAGGQGTFGQGGGGIGGGIGSLLQKADLAGNVMKGIQAIKAEKDQVDQSLQTKIVSDYALEARNSDRSNEEVARMRQDMYVRPEDNIVTGEELFPVQGTGYNVLAKKGKTLYAQKGITTPDMYRTITPQRQYEMDSIDGKDMKDITPDMYRTITPLMQYERDSLINERVIRDKRRDSIDEAAYKNLKFPIESYQGGGFMNFMNAGGTDLLGGISTKITNNSGGAQVGGAVGDAVSMIPGVGPVVGAIAKPVLSTIGHFALGSHKRQKQIKKNTGATDRNVNNMMGMTVGDQIKSNFNGFMQDGGIVNDSIDPMEDYARHPAIQQMILEFQNPKKYDSIQRAKRGGKDWNPSIDGGGLKGDYFPAIPKITPSAPIKYQQGGTLENEVQPLWGGDVETMSYNPFAPGDGTTGMITGNSHSQGGVGLQYGNNTIEAEGQEPIVQMENGGNMDKSVAIMGDLPLPKNFKKAVEQTVGDKVKGGKFKTLTKNLSELENKQNKKIDNNVKKAEKYTPLNTLDKISIGTLNLNIKDIYTPKLKAIQEAKEGAALVQETFNDTANELGLDATNLVLGKVQTAKKGKTMYAQDGIGPINENENIELNPGWDAEFNIPQERDWATFPWALAADESEVIEEETPKKTRTYIKPKDTNPYLPPPGSGRTARPYQSVSKNKDNIYYGGVTQEQYDDMVTANQWYFKDHPDFDPNNPEDVRKFQEAAGIKAEGKIGPQTASVRPSPNVKSEDVVMGELVGNTDKLELLGSVSENKEDIFKGEEPKKFDWLSPLNQIPGMFQNTDAEPFDNRQLIPEMWAMSNNQLEPVDAQKFHPRLRTPYKVSMQDMRNDIIGQSRIQDRLTQNNPGLAGANKAGMYEALNKIGGEEFRQNQGLADKIQAENLATLNDADWRNLGIMDRQYERQAQAKANTKATDFAAINSISDKIAKHALENKTLRVWENMYDYRYDATGKAHYQGPPVDWEVMWRNKEAFGQQGQLLPGYEYVYDSKGKPIDVRKAKGSTYEDDLERVGGIKNAKGSIVKQYKKFK